MSKFMLNIFVRMYFSYIMSLFGPPDPLQEDTGRNPITPELDARVEAALWNPGEGFEKRFRVRQRVLLLALLLTFYTRWPRHSL